MESLLKGQFKLVKSSSLITGEAARNDPWEVAPKAEGWLLELIWGHKVGDTDEGEGLVVVKSFPLFCSLVPCLRSGSTVNCSERWGSKIEGILSVQSQKS